MLPIISLSFLHMLVKFEEEEKKKVPVPQPSSVDINHLSTQAGMMEAQIDQEKYTPTKEELDKLEDELRKLNEQKFGSLELEVTETPKQIEDEYDFYESEKKRLNYVRSHG
jgi:ribosomal protein L11 methylase PrmA